MPSDGLVLAVPAIVDAATAINVATVINSSFVASEASTDTTVGVSVFPLLPYC